MKGPCITSTPQVRTVSLVLAVHPQAGCSVTLSLLFPLQMYQRRVGGMSQPKMKPCAWRRVGHPRSVEWGAPGRRGPVLRGTSTPAEEEYTRRIALSGSDPRTGAAQKASSAGRRAGRRRRPVLPAGGSEAWHGGGAGSALSQAFVPCTSILGTLGPERPGSPRAPSLPHPGPRPPAQSELAACTSCGCSLPGVVWVLIFVLHLENYP